MRTLLLCTLLATWIQAQDLPAPERLAAARDAAAGAVGSGAVPSLAVAVVEEGRLIWAEGFGLADREQGTRADADTIYRIASISKPITATALMLLVERGLADLDAPASGYLEAPVLRAFAGRVEDITLRRLCNHTAGLPTHWNFFYHGAQPPPREATIAAYGFAAWPPGSRTNYSNLAFGIVDHVISRRSGRSYRDFLVEELLDPAGMSHTDAGVRPGLERHAAVGYRTDALGRFVPVSPYGFDHDGASIVRSSARDLMRFALLHMQDGELDGRRILAPETVRAMREPRAQDAGSRFGIAWSVGRERGAVVQQHTGGMPGVATVLKVFPERRLAAAVLTNCRNRGPGNAVMGRILDALLGEESGEGGAASGPSPVGPPELERPLRGFVEHLDGPMPLAVVPDIDLATVRLGVESQGRCPIQGSGDVLRIPFRGQLLSALSAGSGTPELELELERREDAWQGVLYANADGTFRLPHAVRLEPEADKPEGTFRVVTYNVLVGFRDHAVGDPYLPGAQRRMQALTWLAAQQPDVVALQELNGYTAGRLLRDAAAWGHGHAVMLKEEGYPTGLTSRHPIEVVERRREGLHHGILHCRTGGIDFVVVHCVPMPGVDRRLREVEQVLGIYRSALEAGRPVVLLGDFNATSPADRELLSDAALERYRRWSYALAADGRPETREIDAVLAAGAVDVFARQRRGDGLLPLPRIDFVFADPELAARSRGAQWLCAPGFLQRSDHPPVVTDFAWTPR